MIIVLVTVAAAAALGVWKLSDLWHALPRRNADLVLF